MPVSDVSRWRGWPTGLAELPQPVTIRCARCGFATEGQLEQAREAFQTHECERQEGSRDGRD